MSLVQRTTATFGVAMVIIASIGAACHPTLALVEAGSDASTPRRAVEVRTVMVASTVLVEADTVRPTDHGWRSTTGRGTGAIIGAEGPIVLTAYHVVADATTTRILFLDPHGNRTGGMMEMEVWRSSENKDVALLRPTGSQRCLPPLIIARQIPSPNESVWFYGGASGFSAGTVLRDAAQLRPRGRTIEIASTSTHGDSGAPCTNDRGELVGVLIAGSPGSERVYFIRIDDALASLGVRRNV